MTLNPEERQKRRIWLEQEFTLDTYLLLRTLNHFNLDSRRIVARVLADQIYTPLRSRSEAFAGLDEPSRQVALNLINVELMSTVFMALEDFGKLLLVTKSPPKLWAPMLISTKEGRSLSELERRQRLTLDRVRQIFALRDAAAYGLTDSDRLVTRYHAHLAEELNAVFDRAARFVLLHRLAYDRYKHGNPIFFNMSGRQIGEGFDAPVTILQRRPSQASGEVIVVGRRSLRGSCAWSSE